MTTHLDEAADLLARYDALDVGNRISESGQALLAEVRTRALVSIAASLEQPRPTVERIVERPRLVDP